MKFDVLEFGYRLGLIFVPFLLALCAHEYAHGLVAKWKGDRTPEQLGRLTLNPMAHADLIGTFILPILSIGFGSPIFFGWAKPVPVDPRQLKNPRVDLFWIALAGPLSNVIMAIATAGILTFVVHYVPAVGASKAGVQILNMFILTNLFLAVFNMIPIHPLDGGKVLARFLPRSWNYWLEQNEQMTGIVLLVLVFSGALAILRYPVMWMHSILISWV